MPSEADVLGDDRRHRPIATLEPREGGHELPDELMAAPEPVEPVVAAST